MSHALGGRDLGDRGFGGLEADLWGSGGCEQTDRLKLAGPKLVQESLGPRQGRDLHEVDATAHEHRASSIIEHRASSIHPSRRSGPGDREADAEKRGR